MLLFLSIGGSQKSWAIIQCEDVKYKCLFSLLFPFIFSPAVKRFKSLYFTLSFTFTSFYTSH